MAFISRPVKVAGFTEYVQEVTAGAITILASEVDADFDTIYTEFDGGIDDSNIAGGANINGNKIAIGTLPGNRITNAPSGIDTAQINNGAVTNAKIAPLAVDEAQIIPGATSAQILQATHPGGVTITTEATVLTQAITTRGGPVRLQASVTAIITPNNAELTGTVVTWRLKRDGTTLDYGGGNLAVFGSLFIRDAVAGTALAATFTIPIPFIDKPTAGLHTYTVTAQTTTGTGGVVTSFSVLVVEEAA